MRSRSPILPSTALRILCLATLVIPAEILRSAPEGAPSNTVISAVQPVAPEHVAGSQTLTESAVLSTRTPVGEASIRLPSGSVVEISASKGDWIQIRKSPFSGWVRTPEPSPQPGKTASASPIITPSPAPKSVQPRPEPSSAADGPAMMPNPARAATVMPDWIFQGLRNPDSPLHLILLAYAGFSSILLLILLVVVLRLRGSDRRNPDQPVVSLEVKTPPLPGFVDCPLCKAPLSLVSLSAGRNSCPNCGGTFECE